MLNRFLKDVKLQSIISQLWLYYGTHPDKLSAFYYSYAKHDYLTNGANYIEGGAGALSDAFRDVITENGGVIMLNSEAKKILLNNHSAIGVATQDGDYFSDIIISGMDLRKTFLNLIGAEYFKSKFIRKLKDCETSISFFVVYLGLNVDLKEKGILDYEIFYNPAYELKSQVHACLNNKIDEAPFMLSIYSNVDETLCPKGKSSLSISMPNDYAFWAHLSKDEYKKTKYKLADILIKRVERVIPKLSAYIETSEITTPLTMERYTGNHRGAPLGFSQLVYQSGLHRISQKPPIKNLYLASAWTRPGGGIMPVMYSAEHITEEILKRKQKKPWQ